MLCFDEFPHRVAVSPRSAWSWCTTGLVILSSFTNCSEAKPLISKLLFWVDVADGMNPCCIRWNVKFSAALWPRSWLPSNVTEEVPFSCFLEGDINVLCCKRLSQPVHFLAVLLCSKDCGEPLRKISLPNQISFRIKIALLGTKMLCLFFNFSNFSVSLYKT